MIVIAMIATIWTMLTALVIGACFAARLGDQNQGIDYPTPSQADPHVAWHRRRKGALPGRLRSPHNLSMR